MRYAMMLIVLFACALTANAQQLTKSGDAILIGQANGSVREIARDGDGALLSKERLVKINGPVKSLDFINGRYEFRLAVLGETEFTVIRGWGDRMTSKASVEITGARSVLALNSAQYQVGDQAFELGDRSLVSSESIPLPEGREVRTFAWMYPNAVMALDTQGVVWTIPLMEVQGSDSDALTVYTWGTPEVFTAEYPNAVSVACDSDHDRKYTYLLLGGENGGLVCLDAQGRWIAETKFSVNKHRAGLDVSLDGTIFAVESGDVDTVWHYEVPTADEGFSKPQRFARASHITALQVISSARIAH
jgi:hypothetical protein